jgi:hypothetical protein
MAARAVDAARIQQGYSHAEPDFARPERGGDGDGPLVTLKETVENVSLTPPKPPE